jgi:hypothetical protein
MTMRVLTVAVDGRGRREAARVDGYVFRVLWSPSGRALAATLGCPTGDPVAWRGPAELAVATTSDGCGAVFLDADLRRTGGGDVWPSDDGSRSYVLYRLAVPGGAAAVVRVLRGIDALEELAAAPTGGAAVVRLEGTQLRLLPLDGGPMRPLPALRPPSGGSVGSAAAYLAD